MPRAFPAWNQNRSNHVNLSESEERELLKSISLMLLMAVVATPSIARPQSMPSKMACGAIAPPGEPPIQSGIYGFSGGKTPESDPEGVVGECIWIFDERDRSQVAKGECAERSPGRFRVVLKPGRYVVHGPGGHTPVEVKPGQWVKIESLVALPLAP
jgi:hypothetical protein